MAWPLCVMAQACSVGELRERQDGLDGVKIVMLQRLDRLRSGHLRQGRGGRQARAEGMRRVRVYLCFRHDKAHHVVACGAGFAVVACGDAERLPCHQSLCVIEPVYSAQDK
jgi:hypothetical protein